MAVFSFMLTPGELTRRHVPAVGGNDVEDFIEAWFQKNLLKNFVAAKS
jgi:hypothetical protein